LKKSLENNYDNIQLKVIRSLAITNQQKTGISKIKNIQFIDKASIDDEKGK
jgi:hypothetical protein